MAKFPLDDIIFFLDEVFFEIFHGKLPQNLNRSNLNDLINQLREDCQPVINQWQIVNPSDNPEVQALQNFTLKLIGQIKESFEDMEGVIDGLADKLHY